MSREIADKYGQELALVLKYNPELLDKPDDLQLVISIRIQQAMDEAHRSRELSKIQITDLVGVEAFNGIKQGLN